MLIEGDEAAKLDAEGAESEEALTRVYNLSCANAVGMTLIMVFLWPALALPADTFNKSYFGWWVAIAFIWAHFAFAATVLLPIYEFIFPADGYDSWGNRIAHDGSSTGSTAPPSSSAVIAKALSTLKPAELKAIGDAIEQIQRGQAYETKPVNNDLNSGPSVGFVPSPYPALPIASAYPALSEPVYGTA
jgi:hypothetical protein